MKKTSNNNLTSSMVESGTQSSSLGTKKKSSSLKRSLCRGWKEIWGTLERLKTSWSSKSKSPTKRDFWQKKVLKRRSRGASCLRARGDKEKTSWTLSSETIEIWKEPWSCSRRACKSKSMRTKGSKSSKCRVREIGWCRRQESRICRKKWWNSKLPDSKLQALRSIPHIRKSWISLRNSSLTAISNILTIVLVGRINKLTLIFKIWAIKMKENLRETSLIKLFNLTKAPKETKDPNKAFKVTMRILNIRVASVGSDIISLPMLPLRENRDN